MTLSGSVEESVHALVGRVILRHGEGKPGVNNGEHGIHGFAAEEARLLIGLFLRNDAPGIDFASRAGGRCDADDGQGIGDAFLVAAGHAGAVVPEVARIGAAEGDGLCRIHGAAAAEAEQPTERVLIGEAEDEAADGADAAQKPAAKPAQYYTYTPAETSEESCDE